MYDEQHKLKKILLNDDVVESINNNLDTVISIIPEISYMINFPHNHPEHHLDVWNHTLLALSISKSDFDLRLCLLLHDIGKPHSYQDEQIRHFKGHPLKSSIISNEILHRLKYNEDYIKEICYLIENHDNPISRKQIINNYELSLKRYLIQYCDGLAHNPYRSEKRIKYLNYILDILSEYRSDTKEKVKTKVNYNI